MKGELDPPVMLEDMLEAVGELQKLLAINRLTIWHRQFSKEKNHTLTEIEQSKIRDALIAIELASYQLDKVRKSLNRLKILED